MSEDLSRICFNFIAMVAPLISWASNNPTVMCFCSQLAKRKFTTTTKTSWLPFDIQRSKVHVVVMHSTKASYTYFLKVLLNNVGRMSSMKTFLDGKFTLRHNRRANLCIQMDSTIVNGKKNLDDKQHYVFQESLLGLMIFWERV